MSYLSDDPVELDDEALYIHNHALIGDFPNVVKKFMQYRGDDLTQLKIKVDGYDAVNNVNMIDIVFDPRMDDTDRTILLKHFLSQACKAHEMTILMTDVDDTLFPSKIGGTDRSLPNKVLYPGVIAFQQAIAPTGPIVVLTARPKFMKSKTYSKLKHAMGNKREISVLSGRSRDIPMGALGTLEGYIGGFFGRHEGSEVYRGMASTKADNFVNFQKVFPELSIIFTGDSGQGDVLTAESMNQKQGQLECMRKQPSFMGAFIHDVQRTTESKSGRLPPAIRKELLKSRIYVFDTYVGAAAIARDMGWIRKSMLRNIIEEAKKDLSNIEQKHGIQNYYRYFLDQDIKFAHDILKKHNTY